MKRHLSIADEIDADEHECGPCNRRSRGLCGRFETSLYYATEPHDENRRVRHHECIEAERAAMPRDVAETIRLNLKEDVSIAGMFGDARGRERAEKALAWIDAQEVE